MLNQPHFPCLLVCLLTLLVILSPTAVSSVPTVPGGMLPPATGNDDRYRYIQLAAKFYFELKGDLSPRDIEGCKEVIHGCVVRKKLQKFLKGKFVPARDRVKGEDNDHDVKIGQGRFHGMHFQYGHSEIPLLEDFSIYLRTRTSDRVPYPVQQLLLASEGNTNEWPGNQLPPESFFPSDVMVEEMFGINVTVAQWAKNYTEPVYTYPHPGCRLTCRMQLMKEHELPMALAGEADSQNHVGFDGGKHTLEAEETRFFWETTVQYLTSLAANIGMYLMALLIITMAAGMFFRLYVIPHLGTGQDRPDGLLTDFERPSDIWLQRMRRQGMRIWLASNSASASSNNSELSSPSNSGNPLSPSRRAFIEQHTPARVSKERVERVFDRLLYRTPSSFKSAVTAHLG